MARLAILLALAAGTFSQEEPDIARWIADLGHEEIAKREEAHGHLLKAGTKALAVLKAALDSKDAEKVSRVRRIIEEIERPERERKHDLEQRRIQLPVYSVDFKDTPAAEVFRKVGELLGREVKSEADPEARVTYAATQAPLQQILDALEDRLDVSIRAKSSHWEVTRLALPRKPRAYAPGVMLELTPKTIQADGKTAGVRIKADAKGGVWTFVDAWEVRDSSGKVRAVRHCGSCGPFIAFVEGEPSEFRIRLKGRIIWRSEYELKVERPDTPQVFLVGGFTIAYDFPRVTVSSPTGVPSLRFPHAELVGTLKPGVERRSRWGGRIGVGGGFGRRKPAGWCDCQAGPSPEVERPVELIETSEFQDNSEHPLGDFESMILRFTKRIEEPFEAEVVVPEDAR